MEVGSGGGGVGSTEPHRRRLDGAGREAQEPTSPAPKRKTSGGAGFAGAEAGTGENITIRPGRRVTLLTDTAELAVTETSSTPFATRARRPSVSSTSTPRRAASATTSVAGTL